jgi:hypothetical protein
MVRHPLIFRSDAHPSSFTLRGLWGGFAIASAGTVIGESYVPKFSLRLAPSPIHVLYLIRMVFYLFKTFFHEKAKKVEQENIAYGCVARMMRDGGVYIVTMVRFSAVGLIV